jgi:hypothetical protein
MLEVINELIKFDQNHDTYVFNFVGNMKYVVQISNHHIVIQRKCTLI